MGLHMNHGLQMNIHIDDLIDHKQKRQMEEDEVILDEHKMKLINYEKKLLEEKKVTYSSKSLDKLQDPQEPAVEDIEVD